MSALQALCASAPLRLNSFFAIIRSTYNLMRSPSHNRSSRFAAVCCLLAVALLHAPLAAAVSAAAGMPCCTGSQCSVALYRHSHNPSPAPASSSHAKDCGHEERAATGISSCNMSCCHDVDRAIVGSGLFLLPQTGIFVGTVQIGLATTSAKPAEMSFGLEPPSPPPRVTLSAL